MTDAHKNFAYSTVATAPSPASSGLSLVVQSGDGVKFPAAPFNATVWPAGAQPTTLNAEIVRVTLAATDTFTITRAQESTSARSIGVGDQIAATITAKTLTDVEHDQYANTYLAAADETIPESTQVIYEDYLELAASFVYELAGDAILVIGDFSSPLPAPDQNPNLFVTVADEAIPTNGELIFSDMYELSPPFAVEIRPGALLQLGTGTITSFAQVFDYTLAADAVMLDTGSIIPPGYSALRVMIHARSSLVASSDILKVTFNGDAGANQYGSEVHTSGSTTAQGSDFAVVNSAQIVISADSSPASDFAQVTLDILGYGDTVYFKTATFTYSYLLSAAGNNQYGAGFIKWQQAAAINRIALSLPSTSVLRAGSRMTIWAL